MFAHFALPNVRDVARRTVAAALSSGSPPWSPASPSATCSSASVPASGWPWALVNFRLVGVSVDRVTAMDVDNPKRPLAVNTLGRMGIITVVALGLVLVSKPLGFGVLGGLAVFQILLIANVARSMAKAGPMTSVDDVINANVDRRQRACGVARRHRGRRRHPRRCADQQWVPSC